MSFLKGKQTVILACVWSNIAQITQITHEMLTSILSVYFSWTTNDTVEGIFPTTCSPEIWKSILEVPEHARLAYHFKFKKLCYHHN